MVHYQAHDVQSTQQQHAQALGDAQVRKLLDWSLSPQEASRQAFSGTRLVPQKNVELQASLRLQTQVAPEHS